jgi:hypothetical protein
MVQWSAMGEPVDEPQTCGQGLAANAVLPARMAGLLGALAGVLAKHVLALDERNPDALAERAAYEALVHAHQDITQRLEALARQMESYRDLPLAPHDEDVMHDPTLQAAAFQRYVAELRTLAELLNTMVTENEALLG